MSSNSDGLSSGKRFYVITSRLLNFSVWRDAVYIWIGNTDDNTIELIVSALEAKWTDYIFQFEDLNGFEQPERNAIFTIMLDTKRGRFGDNYKYMNQTAD